MDARRRYDKKGSLWIGLVLVCPWPVLGGKARLGYAADFTSLRSDREPNRRVESVGPAGRVGNR